MEPHFKRLLEILNFATSVPNALLKSQILVQNLTSQVKNQNFLALPCLALPLNVTGK